MTHVECRGHHGAQSLGAEAVEMETMVRRPKKWREPAVSWRFKSRGWGRERVVIRSERAPENLNI